VYRRYLSLSTSISIDSTDKKDEVLEPPCTTGIEHLLTPDLIKKSRAVRARCKKAVLDEQERQDRAGEHDPIKLADVSNNHSKWSTKRAVTVGLLQSRDLR